MIIETYCDPRAEWDGVAQNFTYTFLTPMTVSVGDIKAARPGHYHPKMGSIINIGGPDFGIAYDYNELAEKMRECHRR